MSLELQKFIFESEPSRRKMLNYVSECEKKFRVQVFRNHSFELLEHTIGAYLDYAGMGITFFYSGYDDSFSFMELDATADLVLIWIDMTRYTSGTAAVFLDERISQLRMRFSGPILLVPFGKKIELLQTGVVVLDLSPIEERLGANFIDERAKSITGTLLSSKAMMAISRELGLRYLPALLQPALKAVVVDLDNTLYRGVLGEDGANGIIMTTGHRQLQEHLKQLSATGFFLCLASKNNAEDVERLFEMRTDFPLRKEDFSIICSTWDSKADSIEKIARFLNINPDSMVFVDDNVGELTAVQLAFPSIKIIHANEDGRATCNVLKEFPGLLKLDCFEDDLKRKDDVKANKQRQTLQRKLSPEEYLRSLEIHLQFAYDNAKQIRRISELASKTNQFIFNYMRYTQAEVEARMLSKDYAVAAVSLSDKLSDSGLVGVCVGRAVENYVEIEECFISCRALGRGIDDVIVLGTIDGIAHQLGRQNVKVLFQKGERNVPAERFVQTYLTPYLENPARFHFVIPENLLAIEII